MDLERLEITTKIIEYQKSSPDWIPISNVDCPWDKMLIPRCLDIKLSDSSIIYFNRKYINSEITIIPLSVFTHQTFEPYQVYSIIVQQHLIPMLRTFDPRRNWKQLVEDEQEAVIITINEWLVKQLQNAKKRNPGKKVILFFYGVIEKRVELNGYVKNSVDYIARYVIKIF